MKSISVVTLGCKVNQYDTAAILNRLPESKYKTVPFPEKADIYVIDTCTVTHKADSEARRCISRARRSNPDGIVIVTGCYAQVSSDEVKKIEGVDYVIGNSHKFSSLLKAIREGQAQDEPKLFISDIFREKKKSFETPGIERFPGRTRAFLKVQDGCNYACTFCIIPRARGRSRSLEIDEIIKRMETLADAGYKEIVLTGVHIASYGRDIGTTFPELIRRIDDARVVGRVRLTSLDPADMDESFVRQIAASKTICPQFHVALQSGDANILKRMRRRYAPERFLEMTGLIRETMPDAAIGSDIMVGFPGETDEEFANTCETAGKSALTYFHVFPYSRRRETPAAAMPDQVRPDVIRERSKALRAIGVRKKKEFYSTFIGRTLPVLVESGNTGTTHNYISVRITGGDFEVGDEALMTITGLDGEEALAAPIREARN
ncbi:MAG: tRNA (N(6)-L-threonylcarbamoyladenosine(37)-C(2))-methylthiotransferase MtaB [Candidatus Dadabacteria bacterium]